jgi:hypothetical protein
MRRENLAERGSVEQGGEPQSLPVSERAWPVPNAKCRIWGAEKLRKDRMSHSTHKTKRTRQRWRPGKAERESAAEIALNARSWRPEGAADPEAPSGSRRGGFGDVPLGGPPEEWCSDAVDLLY